MVPAERVERDNAFRKANAATGWRRLARVPDPSGTDASGAESHGRQPSVGNRLPPESAPTLTIPDVGQLSQWF